MDSKLSQDSLLKRLSLLYCKFWVFWSKTRAGEMTQWLKPSMWVARFWCAPPVASSIENVCFKRKISYQGECQGCTNLSDLRNFCGDASICYLGLAAVSCVQFKVWEYSSVREWLPGMHKAGDSILGTTENIQKEYAVYLCIFRFISIKCTKSCSSSRGI